MLQRTAAEAGNAFNIDEVPDRKPPRRLRPRRYQASPDKAESRRRRRVLGGQLPAPAWIRALFSQGEQAVMHIIAAEVRVTGRCELFVDVIAARAGVCRSTVKNAIAEARRHALVMVLARRRGWKNRTNVITIVCAEWLAWLASGNRVGAKIAAPIIKARILSPTKSQDPSLLDPQRAAAPQKGSRAA